MGLWNLVFLKTKRRASLCGFGRKKTYRRNEAMKKSIHELKSEFSYLYVKEKEV